MNRRDRAVRRRAAALLLVLLFLSVPVLSPAEAAGPDTEMILARNAMRLLGVEDENGQPPDVRRAEDLPGRGEAGADGKEPDYVGVLGYAALPVSSKISTFSNFSETPWALMEYEKDGEQWKRSGRILHKTPVVVVAQELRPGNDRRYRGYLRVIRLDENRLTWISAGQFVTVPYWTYRPEEAVRLGNCVAVYRNTSRYDPMDRGRRTGAVPDGLRVLLCDRHSTRLASPDKLSHPLLGIVFHGTGEEETGMFLFFNPGDLTIVY